MTPQVALVLGIVAVATFLFWWEKVSADVVALGVLMALVVTGLLPAEQAWSGFGSDAVILILGLLILTAALERTGVVDLMGRFMLRHASEDPRSLLLTVMIASATLGAFMSNTASTAFFLPVVFGIARKSGTSLSRLLLPLAFAGILTSSVTLVSTSTNIVVSGMMTRYGLEPMGMFELAPVGIPIAIVGLAYLYLTRRLIPERTPAAELTERFGVRPYLSEVVVAEGSSLVGKTLAEARIGPALGLTVLRVLRGGKYLDPHDATVIESGDILLVEGSQEDIVKVKDVAGIDIKADVKLSDPDLETADTGLAEAIILPGSPLLRRTLKGARFRERFGLHVLGLNRRGVNVVQKLSQVPLGLGDVLLLQGRRDHIARLGDERALHVLGPIEDMAEVRPNRSRAPLAIAIFASVLAAATANVLPLPVATMAGVLLVFLTRCVTPEEAYDAVEWRVIILIGSMLGLGVAMESSGTAAYLAGAIVEAAGGLGPAWLLTGFFALTVLLTQPMSNQAAAIVVLPVAIEAARAAGLNPRTFAMMIAVAASCSYLTPLEPSCVLVYGPGRYRFADFLRIGAGLTLLIYAIAIVLVPVVWPVR